MAKRGFLTLIAAATLVLGAQAQAATITLGPGDLIGANLGAANCEPGCINTLFGTSFTNADLLYKQNVGEVSESGSFKDYYSTTFANSALDPQDATITWDGPLSISCPTCFLAVKDGNQNPSYYFYNLASWNGMDTIALRGFWPNRGAISHVSIWGAESDGDGGGDGGNVPEPGSLMLLGAGLFGLATKIRKRR